MMSRLERRLRRIGDLPAVVMQFDQRLIAGREQPRLEQPDDIVADRTRFGMVEGVGDFEAGLEHVHLRILPKQRFRRGRPSTKPCPLP